MLKAALRKAMLQKRLQYSAAEVNRWSEQISQLFLASFSLTDIKNLHLFLPISRYNEINTWYLIRQLQQNYPEVSLVVPATNLEEHTLSHHRFTSTTKLVENKWGILEPQTPEPVAETVVDLILIPLLGFDEQGHRVGYGKGFYDRFLALCRPDVLKIGLSLEAPINRITDIYPGDVVLDYAVTPEKVFAFQDNTTL